MENQMDNYMEATKVVFFDGWPSLRKPSCILYMHASWKMAWVQPLPLSIPKNVRPWQSNPVCDPPHYPCSAWQKHRTPLTRPSSRCRVPGSRQVALGLEGSGMHGQGLTVEGLGSV